MNNYTITTYDTMTGTMVDVPVSEEIYTAFVRTAWTIKKNNQKHWKHEIPFSCLRGAENLDVLNEFADYKSDPAYVDPDEELYEQLQVALNQLEQDEQDLVFALFYKNMTLTECSDELGISPRGVGKRRDRIIKKIKAIMEENEIFL